MCVYKYIYACVRESNMCVNMFLCTLNGVTNVVLNRNSTCRARIDNVTVLGEGNCTFNSPYFNSRLDTSYIYIYIYIYILILHRKSNYRLSGYRHQLRCQFTINQLLFYDLTNPLLLY